MFLNRTRELGYLSERYAAGRAEIVVLYGRRRVGKSALLFEWSEGKPCIFFFARPRGQGDPAGRVLTGHPLHQHKEPWRARSSRRDAG